MRFVPKGLVPALFLFAAVTVNLLSAAGMRWHLAGVSPADQTTAATLRRLGIEHLHLNRNRYEIAVSPGELEAVRRAGLYAEVLIEDYGAYLYQRNKDAAKLAAAGNIAYGSMGGYFSPDEVLGFVDSLRTSHEFGLISDTLMIGQSLQGRPVWLVEVGGEGNDDSPEVFFNSLVHAREGMSLMSLLYFMRFLSDNYESVDSVRWLLDNRRMFFVPVVNPDGYEINWNIYADSSRFGLWRKNAKDNNSDGSLVFPLDGVDINRNFSYKWGYDNNGSKPTWTAQDYRGDSAFSESETRLIRDFVVSHDFRVAINCHSYGNYLLKPWSYIAGETPDSATFNRLGVLMVEANGFGHGNATALLAYPANGELTDWEYGDSAHGGIFAWTAEIGDSRWSFWPPSDQIDRIAANVLPTFFAAARAAGFWPRIQVTGTGQVDGKPRRLKVTVNVDNAGLGNTDEPYTITLRGLGRGGTVVTAINVPASSSYPRADSLVVEFGPEVYQLMGNLVVEQQGLAVTSVPVTLSRTTTDVSGDLDGSGRTDIFDLLAELRVISRGVPVGDSPQRYDLNFDGKVDIFDLLDLLARLRRN